MSTLSPLQRLPACLSSLGYPLGTIHCHHCHHSQLTRSASTSASSTGTLGDDDTDCRIIFAVPSLLVSCSLLAIN